MMLARRSWERYIRRNHLYLPQLVQADDNIVLVGNDKPFGGHCQSKFVYFVKMSEPDFAAIDFPAFFRVDLSGSMAIPTI
jgi:hypothetical protein